METVQFWPRNPPLRILVVNSLLECSQIAIVRMISGSVFGTKQLLDITLLVYINEIQEAQGFIQEVMGCNFGCLYRIVASSDLPGIDDADIFCFMSNFKNPNVLDDGLDTDRNFDTTYLILKVALSLGKSVPGPESKNKESLSAEKYPLIVGDGLLAIDMVHSMGNIDIPSSHYFCSCSPGLFAKTVLGELLKVKCTDINKTCVWGASDCLYHVEVEKPYVIYDTISDKSYCDWQMVSEELLEPLKLDHTQFNASWMKKEFITKLRTMSAQNPYGRMFRGWKLARSLNIIWESTIKEKEICGSLGVISDGSLRTIKGLPYYLPLVFQKNSTKWKVDTQFEELPHLKQEIEIFNKVAKKSHERLIKYCTKFIEENIVRQSFLPPDSEDFTSSYSTSQASQILL